MSQSSKIIKVTCKGSAQLRPDELEEFQGDLKTLSEKSYQKLKAAIADPQIGFSFPIFVWKNKKKNYIIDGHQRLITIRRMIQDGWTLKGGKLPVDWIEAPDIKTAKKKVILAVSQYGVYDDESFSEFLQNANIDFNELKDQIDLPQIDLEQFALDWKEITVRGGGKDIPEKEENLRPFKKMHILISFNPSLIADVEPFLKKIIQVPGVEYEQCSN